jgi:hypothetical protein
MTSITFLGAARTVTGSKYLLDTGTSKVLIDAGLFQGLKELRERNGCRFPIARNEIDAIVADARTSGPLRLFAQARVPGISRPRFLHRRDVGSLSHRVADAGRIQEEMRQTPTVMAFETCAGVAALHRSRRVSRRVATAAGRLRQTHAGALPVWKLNSSMPDIYSDPPTRACAPEG